MTEMAAEPKAADKITVLEGYDAPHQPALKGTISPPVTTRPDRPAFCRKLRFGRSCSSIASSGHSFAADRFGWLPSQRGADIIGSQARMNVIETGC